MEYSTAVILPYPASFSRWLIDRESRVDGFLRLWDIYNLRLPVDLVVLSACQTALGKEIKGEGLVG